MKKYYVGQTPVETLLIAVVDERGQARDLSIYDSAVVLFGATNGFVHDDAGTATITDAPNGKISFVFTGQSVFTGEGKYRVQVKLIDGARADYADIAELEVLKGLDDD